MKFGLKVHHTDLAYLIDMEPDALEFALFPGDVEGSWVDDVKFDGPIVVHMPEKFKDGTLIDPASSDDKKRSASVNMLKRTIDLSEKLNASIVILHPGGVRKSPESVDNSPLLDSMGELLSYAPKSIELILENMPDIYWYNGELISSCLFKDEAEISGVLKQLNMGMCMDVCHAKLHCNASKVDFYSYIKQLKPFIRHVHVSDAGGISYEGMQIGDGEIDFRGILPLLEGLDVIAVPEILNGHEDRGEGFRVAVSRLKALGYFDTPLKR